VLSIQTKCKKPVFLALAALIFILLTAILLVWAPKKADDYLAQGNSAKTSPERLELLIKSDFLRPDNDKKIAIASLLLTESQPGAAEKWLQRLRGGEKNIYLAGLSFEMNKFTEGDKFQNLIQDAKIKEELGAYRDFLRGEDYKTPTTLITDYQRVILFFEKGEAFNVKNSYSLLGQRVEKGETKDVELARELSEYPALAQVVATEALKTAPTSKELLIIKKESLLQLENEEEALKFAIEIARLYPEPENVKSALTLANKIGARGEIEILRKKLELINSL
jgi:hypothetical protein